MCGGLGEDVEDVQIWLHKVKSEQHPTMHDSKNVTDEMINCIYALYSDI